MYKLILTCVLMSLAATAFAGKPPILTKEEGAHLLGFSVKDQILLIFRKGSNDVHWDSILISCQETGAVCGVKETMISNRRLTYLTAGSDVVREYVLGWELTGDRIDMRLMLESRSDDRYFSLIKNPKRLLLKRNTWHLLF